MGFFDNIGGAITNVVKNPTNALTGGAIGGIIGGAPGQILGGLIGGDRITKGVLGEDAPTYNQLAVPEELQGRLDKYQNSARQTPEQLQAKYMEGVSGAGGALGFDPTSSALSGRSKRAFERSAGDLNRQSFMQAAQKTHENLGQAYNAQTSLDNFKRGLDQRAQQYEAENEATRNAVIGSIFGGVGQGIGKFAGSQKG